MQRLTAMSCALMLLGLEGYWQLAALVYSWMGGVYLSLDALLVHGIALCGIGLLSSLPWVIQRIVPSSRDQAILRVTVLGLSAGVAVLMSGGCIITCGLSIGAKLLLLAPASLGFLIAAEGMRLAGYGKLME